MTNLGMFFLPINQQLPYFYRLSTLAGETGALLSALALAGFLILAIFSFRKNKLLTLGILWFLVTLSVESSIIALPNFIFVKRMYLPLMGLIWAALALLYSYASW